MKANSKFFGLDIFSVAGEIAKQIWTKILAINFIQFVAMLFLGIPIITYMLGINFGAIIEYMNMPMQERMSNPNVLMDMMMGGMAAPSKFFLGLILMSIVSLYIYSWAYNAMYNIAANYMSDKDESFGDTLKKSNDGRVWRLMGASILLGLIIFVVYLVGGLLVGLIAKATSSVTIVVILAIGLVFFILTMTCKYLLAFPAISLGEMQIMEAMVFSGNKISRNKAMKYAAIGIGAILALGIAMLLIQFIIGMVLPASFFSIILSQIVSLVIGAYIGAYIIGALTALYYREADLYTGEDGDSFSGVEHLV